MAMKSPYPLKVVEDNIEHTCATCDHYVDGWDGRHHTCCGLCWMRWQGMAMGTGRPKLGIDSASVCMVDGEGYCDEWTEAEDDE